MAGRVLWALPPALIAADDGLTQALDGAVRAGERAAGRHVVFPVGRTDCCIGRFEFTALDAARLRREIEALERERPELAATVRRRAEAQWRRLRGVLPGGGARPGDTIVAAVLATAPGAKR